MSSVESSAAADPSLVAQQVAAAQSASAEPVAENTQSEDITAPPALAGNFGALEVDYGLDHDSTLGEDSESLTTSLNSTVTDYKYEHGRRYHAFQDGKYALPNDDTEIARLELQHRVWHHSLSGRLNLAPLPPTIHSALDLGCGTGAWAINFGEAHPECRVIGCDLSPIQPTLVPPNVEFLVDDITSEWVYSHKFDYIHSRAITVGIRDWHKLVDECWRWLQPGGWIEFQEYHMPFVSDDGSIENGPAFKLWNENMLAATNKAGTHLDAILGVGEILKTRGFTSLGEAHTKWPLGPWAKGRREKKVGSLLAQELVGGLEGVSMRVYTKMLGWSPEDVTKHVKEAERDISSLKMHAYIPIDFVWAQKPHDAGSA